MILYSILYCAIILSKSIWKLHTQLDTVRKVQLFELEQLSESRHYNYTDYT